MNYDQDPQKVDREDVIYPTESGTVVIPPELSGFRRPVSIKFPAHNGNGSSRSH